MKCFGKPYQLWLPLEETLIVEDSIYGLLAADRSNSHILGKNPSEVTLENINRKINSLKSGQSTRLLGRWKIKYINSYGWSR